MISKLCSFELQTCTHVSQISCLTHTGFIYMYMYISKLHQMCVVHVYTCTCTCKYTHTLHTCTCTFSTYIVHAFVSKLIFSSFNPFKHNCYCAYYVHVCVNVFSPCLLSFLCLFIASVHAHDFMHLHMTPTPLRVYRCGCMLVCRCAVIWCLH